MDPKGDTPATVRAFLAAHEMTDRMRYLIGSFKQLAPVWKAWGIAVLGSPNSREVGHSAFLYGITGHGKSKRCTQPTSTQPGSCTTPRSSRRNSTVPQRIEY